jgi:hypothetical protein
MNGADGEGRTEWKANKGMRGQWNIMGKKAHTI